MTTATLRLLHHSSLDGQHVSLSQILWSKLVSEEEPTWDPATSRPITVSLAIPSLATPLPLAPPSPPPAPSSFLVYASPFPETVSGQDHGLVLSASPHFIKETYGQDTLAKLYEEEEYGRSQDANDEDNSCACMVSVSRVELIELDEVVIGALDAASYEYAQQNQDTIISHFSSKSLIIRSAGRYVVDGHSFQVLMTGPVQQGVIAPGEQAKIIIVDITSSTPQQDPKLNSASASLLSSFSMLTTTATPKVEEPHEFPVTILDRPWPEHHLIPAPTRMDDEENRVFVDVKGLALCGVFSGDWVLVSADDSKKARLCRIYGADTRDTRDQPVVYLPPALYFNLGLPLPPTPIDKSSIYITRLAIPPSAGPPLASEVTVAPVASPTSMDKTLRKPFVEALKCWFEDKERIVCNGDVIAIGLNEDSARLRPLEDDENSLEDATKKARRQPSVLAYFMVTNLETEEEPESAATHPAYFGAGRKVVPSHTKMIQKGVEHSRVPIGSLSHYYHLSQKMPLYRTTTAAYTQLYELLSSSLHPMARDVELSCNALLHGPRGGGKATLVREIAEELGIHMYEFTSFDVLSDTDAKTEVHLRSKFEKAMALSPCIVLLRSVEGLSKKSVVIETGQEPLMATVLQDCIKTVNAAHAKSGFPVMVIATTSDVEQLPSSILACFRHEVAVEAPDEGTRLRILKSLTFQSPMAPDVSLTSLATQTAALVGKDLVDLVSRAGTLALQRIHQAVHSAENEESPVARSMITPNDIKAAGIALTAADFDAALSEARSSYSDSIGAPKIPNVTWDDVGGMADVKDDILDTIQLPLEHPELFGSGLKKRSGILLYGPPGTGKTLLAKAIATSCSLNFFSVKGPELLNMYIGESEANVRRVFQRARDAKPCVIFFDELDSVAPKRGEKGDSGGVMDRIVSQMLAELDGMSEGGQDAGVGDVFVIGATNRPDLLDPALLRPGRFDKLLYLGVSQDHESQLRIIQALTRKFRLHPELNLARVAELCPFHYTGADFYALCTDAMLKAMTRVAETIDDKVKGLNAENRQDLPQPVTVQYYLSHMATPEDIVVQVEEVDFVRALDELVPSVSATELAHYSKVREKFEQKKEEPEAHEQKARETEAPTHETLPPVRPSKDKGKGKAHVKVHQ